MSQKSRRNLLKSIVAGSAATTLPNTWNTPVINSVVLPAHGAMTAVSCNPGSLSLEDFDGGNANEDIAIVYDCNQCSLVGGSFSGGGFPDDTVAAFDIDSFDLDGMTFDLVGPGANWTWTSAGGLTHDDNGGNNPPGTYTIIATRGECSISMTFTIGITTSTTNPNKGILTVSGVSITPM